MRFCPLLLGANGQLFVELLPWLIALIVLVIIGGVAMYATRRLMHASQRNSEDGFTLHSLRQLHAEGRLSDEEFAKARDAMIGAVRKDAASQEMQDATQQNKNRQGESTDNEDAPDS